MKARVLAGWPTPPESPEPGHPGFTHAGTGLRPYLAAVAFPMEVEGPPTDAGDAPTLTIRTERELHEWAARRFLFYEVVDLAVPFPAVVAENLRIPDEALREAGHHVALAVQLLMPHRTFEDVREAIAGLRDGILLHAEEAFPVTAAVIERREGTEWTYHIEHPDGRSVPIDEPEKMIAVAERVRPEDFRGLVSGRDILRQARGIVLPAAARNGTVIRLRSWPPDPLDP